MCVSIVVAVRFAEGRFVVVVVSEDGRVGAAFGAEVVGTRPVVGYYGSDIGCRHAVRSSFPFAPWRFRLWSVHAMSGQPSSSLDG